MLQLFHCFLALPHKWGNTAFGFGLWISSGWYILSRLQTFVGGQPPPWTLEMAQRLQIVADKSDSDQKCCANPSPVWETMSVSCRVCSKTLDDMARPDLGRKRIDGFFTGGLRLLLAMVIQWLVWMMMKPDLTTPRNR